MGFLGDKGSVPLSSRYKLGTPYPIDIRQSVETEEDIWLLNTWGSYKALQQKWSFSMYPNMLVGVANTNIVYQLNGAVPVIIDQTATRFPEGTWQKLATQEWVLAQEFGSEIPENTYDVYGSAAAAETNAKTYTDGKVAELYTKDDVDGLIQETKDYADANDTKYGIEYNSVTKTIKLVEGGTETEIDASDFIKDGMLSSVVADQDNNKLTFYWNTAAGIETTEIALSSIADIYAGAEGDRVKITVDTDNAISADLIKGSISKDYLDENVQKSLALADSAVQDSDIANFATSESITAVSNDLASYKTFNNEALAQVKTTAEAARTEDEVDGQIDAKIAVLNLAGTYEPIGAETRAKTYAEGLIQGANLEQYTTEQEVKTIVDGVIASAADSDTYNSLTKLVDYIDTHGGEAVKMGQAISALEDQVKAIEDTPAYDITPIQISNWDNEVGAKKLAESKTTTAEVKTQIEAYGYAKVADLGDLASKNSLSAADVGAYTKDQVDDLITNEFEEVKIINPNGVVTGTITFDGIQGSHLQASTGFIANAFGANKSLNEITVYDNTCYAKDGIKIWLPENSDYYSLKYPSRFDKREDVIATQEWVKAQGYGQGSGSIDTTKIVTLDGEQTIIGNKTFTGDVDFSNATVKGLAIDPADVDLAGYATEDWVKSQGFVTASYLDNILTFSTSGSEASAVNYSNDEVLFTEDLYVTNPMGDFVSGDNVKGLSLQEIITRLLKLETNI